MKEMDQFPSVESSETMEGLKEKSLRLTHQGLTFKGGLPDRGGEIRGDDYRMTDQTYNAMNGVIVFGSKGETWATPYSTTSLKTLEEANFTKDSSGNIPALGDASFWGRKNWEEGTKADNLMAHWQKISQIEG